MIQRPIFVVAALAATALVSSPSTARATSLENCQVGQNNLGARLPIGASTSPGFAYRNTLYSQLLVPTTVADVEYPAGWRDPSMPFFALSGVVPLGLYDYDHTTGDITNPHQGGALVPPNSFWQMCRNDWAALNQPFTLGEQQMLEQLWMLSRLEREDLGADVIQLFHLTPATYTDRKSVV